MAAYTLVQAIATNHFHGNMAGDGVGNLYVATENTPGIDAVIYKYDISADVLTDISGATFDTYRHSDTLVAWFDGNLYLTIGEPVGTDECSVYRWDGGTNWTRVDFVSAYAGGAANTNGAIEADSNRLAYRCIRDATLPLSAASYALRVTTNGTSWSSHTGPYINPVVPYYAINRGNLVCPYASSPSSDYPTAEYSGSTIWSNIQTSTQIFRGAIGGYQFFQTSGSGTLYWSTNWGATLNAIAGTWRFQSGIYPQIWDLVHEGIGCGITNANRDEVSIWNSSTKTFDVDGTPAAGQMVRSRPVIDNGYLYVLTFTDGIYVRDAPIINVAYSPSPVSGSAPVSMDVSPDDYYLYVGAMFGGNPVLLRLPADLTADPIEAYAPGAGSAIGVECGDINEEWVWIAGEFGGTIKVRNSLDDGITWTTKDPGAWSGVALPLVVGPDDDNLVLVPTDGDDDLFETLDGGLNWATLNDTLPYDIGGMDRLYWYLDEIVIGTDAAGANRVHYSPNNGATLHDITAGTPNVAINDLIIG